MRLWRIDVAWPDEDCDDGFCQLCFSADDAGDEVARLARLGWGCDLYEEEVGPLDREDVEQLCGPPLPNQKTEELLAMVRCRRPVGRHTEIDAATRPILAAAAQDLERIIRRRRAPQPTP